MGDVARCQECGTPNRLSEPAGACPNCGADPHNGDDHPNIPLTLRAVAGESPTPGSTTGADDLTAALDPSRKSELASQRQPAREFGVYSLERELARGGMGVVYQARQRGLNRTVALKMIRSGELASDDEVKRFQMEAEAAAGLDHPGIVPIYDVGAIDDQHYYTMAYIDGSSLSNVLTDGPLPPRHAATLVAMLAETMQYAHSKGVIHRDLKPGNVLLVEQGEESRGSSSERSSVGGHSTSGRMNQTESSFRWQPRITDFGLAKRAQSDSELTSTGQVLGTPSYMPPEQARGDLDVGPAVDVYSLGAVLYASLVGRPPFQSANALDTIKQVIEQEPVPPSRINGAIGRDLDNICLKCLEKTPGRRYGDAAELADDLYAYLEGRPVKARPIGAFERFWRWCRRKPAIAIAALSGGVAAITLVVLLLVFSQLRFAQEQTKRVERESELSKEKTRRLERESQLREQQLKTAQQRARLDQQIAATQQYYAIVSRVRERNAFPLMGWAYQGLKDIRKANALGVENPDIFSLRETAAQCLLGLDAQAVSEIPMPPGNRSHRVAVDREHGRFAAAIMKNRFQLYACVGDIETGERTHSLTVLPRSLIEFDGIRHITFLDDGNTLAMVTRTGFLHRWDLTKKDSVATTVAVPFGVDQRIAFDEPRGRAFLSHDESLYHWPAFDEQPSGPVLDGIDRVWDVSADGKRLAIRRDGRLQVIEFPSLQVVYEHAEGFRGWFGGNDRLIISEDTQFVLLDLDTGRPIQTMRDPVSSRVHEGVIRQVDLSPDGSLLISGGADQKVKLWDVATGKLKLSIFLGGEDEVCPMFVSNSRFVTTGNMKATVYDLNGRSLQNTIAIRRPWDSFDLSVKPERLITGGVDPTGGVVCLWDGDGAAIRKLWDLGGSPFAPIVHFHNAADSIAVTLSDGRTWAWAKTDTSEDASIATVEDVKTRKVKKPTTALLLSHEEGWFVEDGDQLVRRRLPDLKELSRWSNRVAATIIGFGTITGLATRESHVVAITRSGQLVFFNRDQSVAAMLPVRKGSTAMAVHRQLPIAAYGTNDGGVYLASLGSKENLRMAVPTEDNPHLDSVTSVAFAPNSALLATASRDQTLRLWRVAGDRLEPVLRVRLERAIRKLRFNEQGDLVGLVENEVGLRVWRLQALRSKLESLNLNW